MVRHKSSAGERVARLIRESGLSIYDPIDSASPLFFDMLELEQHLRLQLNGLGLDYPIKTRAKVSKGYVAEAMGYPIPKSFTKNQPRFLGQNLDVYVQKANNLQIWNEDIDPLRRYALIRVNDESNVVDVRVITGETIALLDRTGTLTQKYQASRRVKSSSSSLVSATDTNQFQAILRPMSTGQVQNQKSSPSTRPEVGEVLSISRVYERLRTLVGTQLEYGHVDQERNRGASLHRVACEALGYQTYADTGQFPDILNQALEVKLQTARTIDLGLVSPDSQEPAQELGAGIRHCDVRYAVFYASRWSVFDLHIDGVVVSTGADFFTEFQRFEGNVINKKIQIRLPSAFFRESK